MKKLIVIACFLMAQSSFAWGPTGHRVVGAVAEKYLKHHTQRKLKKLLQGESLASASNWPDEIKSDPDHYSHTYNWHYTDWRNDTPNYDRDHNNGALVVAIENNLSVLKDKKSSDADKVFAIKFLVHLIGDVHMPLHVGNGLDRGGNNCKVVYQGTLSNMHRVWDENMIDFSHLSYTELADFVNVVSKDEVKKIQTGSVLDWARESRDIRETIYPAESTTPDALPSTIPGVKNYCDSSLQLPQTALPQLGYDYAYKFMPVLKRRLLEAGLRLAMALNDAL